MTNVFVRCYDWVGNKIMSLKHPILTIIIIGIIIRLILSVSTFLFDVNYWGLVIRNIKIDQGLYGVEGYYYTPVWGYCLGLLAAFQDLCLNIGEIAVKMIEFAPAEKSNVSFIITTSMIPTLAFAYSIKIPLMIIDIIFAYLVYVLAKDYGATEKQALMALILAFICPTIMHTSSVVSMPDTIGATLTVLTVILLKRNYTFVAGITMSLAILTKFFPAFLLLPLIAYIIAKNRDNKNEMIKQIGFAACGFIIATVAIFLPQLMTGDIMSCFHFITDRASTGVGATVIDEIIRWSRILVYVLVAMASVYFAYVMIKKKDVNPDEKMIEICFILMLFCMLYPPAAQYICILIPFLAFWIAMKDKRYIVGWSIIAIGALLLAIALNPMQLAPWSLNGFIDVNTLKDLYEIYTNNGSMFSIMTVQLALGSILMYIGILVTLWTMYGKQFLEFIDKKRKRDVVKDE